MSQRMTVERGETLMAYLLATARLKRKAVKNLLKFGAVAVNGETVRQFDHSLVPGDTVAIGELASAVAASKLKSARIQLVHEDDALLVLDKPSGLLTVATDHDKTDTLFFRLNEFLRQRGPSPSIHPHVVHRLDRETSGLVLFAKSAEMKQRLQDTWHAVRKTYLAIVAGRPRLDEGTITTYLVESRSLNVFSHDRPAPGAQRATTHYRVLQSRAGLSLVETRLETGRKHQIRVHLAGLGCPVIGDRRYGKTADPRGRLALHAAELVLDHPSTGEPLTFTSPLPRPLGKLFPEFKVV